MDKTFNRRDFLKKTAIAAGAAAGAFALGKTGVGAEWAENPGFQLKTTKTRPDAIGDDRPLLYSVGLIWGFWLNRPKSYDIQQMDLLKDMGATATSATFDWVDLEKKPGEWDWSYPDHAVAAAQERGLKQIGYVGNTAHWALPEGVPHDHSYRHPPDDKHREAFENYCRQVARRYKGRVEMFTFWNEPNGCSWVNDGCSNGHEQELYTKWLKIAYKALKEGNPDCIVAAGRLDYNEGVKDGFKYLEGMYGYGAKGHFDAFAIHPYHPDGLHWNALDDTRRVMVENGDSSIPIWLTEYGWNNSQHESAPDKLREVLTRLSTPKYNYVTVANYLCVTDLPIPGTEQYGLCDRELNERPIAKAFREMAAKAKG